MAAGATTIFALTVRATAAITQNRGINLAGAVPAANGPGYIAMTGGAIGELVTVNMVGTTVAEAGAAIPARGTSLSFDATGRLITSTTGTVVARSVGTAAAVGDLIEVSIIPN